MAVATPPSRLPLVALVAVAVVASGLTGVLVGENLAPSAKTSSGSTSVKISIPVGTLPCWSGLDPVTGDLYVPNYGSQSVSIINGTTVQATVELYYGDPHVATYDPGDLEMYISEGAAYQTSLISGTHLVGNLTDGGVGSQAPVYDPTSGVLYMPDWGDAVDLFVGAISAGTVTGVSGNPIWAALDSTTGALYVDGVTGTNVTVINGSKVVGVLSVGVDPWQNTYDPTNGYVYVPNQGSDFVSVIHGLKVIANITTGNGPSWSLYDPSNHYVYVSNVFAGTETVLSGTSIVATIPVGTNPYQPQYDPAANVVLVTNYGSDNLSVLSGTRAVHSFLVGSEPRDALYDAKNGNIYVTNYGSNNVTVLPSSAIAAVLSGSSPRPTSIVVDRPGETMSARFRAG